MIKRLLPFLAIFVLVDGNQARSYEGQSQTIIESLLRAEGRTFRFIEQKEYDDFVEAHKPEIKPDPIREQARLDLNNRTKTDTERIEALIKYLDLTASTSTISAIRTGR